MTRPRPTPILASLTLALLLAVSAWAQAVKIEKILLEGSDRLTQEAFLALTSLRPGDDYSPARVAEEYRKIWGSGLFEDVTVEARDGESGGKVLVFKVKERPVVASVEYTGSKKLTQSTLLDKLKENDADVKSGSVLDYSRIKKTESALRYIGAEKGFPDASVTSEVKPIGRSQVAVVFHITEGPKARIDKVKFLGNKAFSTTRLRWTLKKTRSHWFGSWATRHDIYSEGRYYEDVKLLRELYESRGYLDVDIADPIVDSRVDTRKNRKWLTLTIPISEGTAYTMGEVSVEGNKLFPTADLMKGFKFKKGQPLDKTAFGYVLKAIEGRYGEKGYIYATATPIYDKDPATRVANITISVSEDQQYFVNRIEFSGNLTTRDYVLRREMLVAEQQILNYRRYQRGLYKLKQTGLFEIKDDPVVSKVPNTNTVDVAVRGTEASKNELLFGGGYGGVNGFFIQGSFRTYNFMGRGVTLSGNVELGKYQKLYSINYTDPWFFGKRVGFMTSIYNNSLSYLQFDQRARGASAAVSFPIGSFGSYQVGYRYERSHMSNLSTTPTYSYSIDPYYQNFYTDSTTSAVTTGVYFNTVNNPFRPTRGLSLSLSALVAGGPLGGGNDFYKPAFEGSYYHPTFKKQNVAFRVNSAYVSGYNGKRPPPWERFFLGGENSLRGFGVRSVYPITQEGRVFLDPYTGTIEGGNRFLLVNAEYIFHVAEQLDVAAFVDAGNTYHERQRWEISNYRANAGVELRIFVPMFNVPLRLIYARNLQPKPGDDFQTFQFTLGLTF